VLSRSPSLLAAILAALALIAPGSAQECAPDSWPHRVAVGADGVATFYVARDCDLECDDEEDPSSLELWIYQESNGHDGLQRQDPNWDNTCNGVIPGDTWLDRFPLD
jgi:hypothetical protein